jgi:putative glutathione S-transferase
MTVHAGPDDSWHGVISAEDGAQFPAEKDRYHLYTGYFCPFAHRAMLVREIFGLQQFLEISVVKAYPKGDDKGWPGWRFNGELGPDDVYPGATEDRLYGSKYLHEVYFKDDPDYKGRYSVPFLWDKKQEKAVCNESAEILRWLPKSFAHLLPASDIDLYPAALGKEIDAMAAWMQTDLNSGVYKAGFAKTQEAYNDAVPTVFAALNRLEAIIHRNGGPFILGKQMTEIDLRAYPTIIRFDVAYVQHFKCNLGTIRGNYPVLYEWLKNLYWNVHGFKETTNFTHIKENYTKSHDAINPLAITPLGPFPDIDEEVSLDFGSLKPGVIRHPAVLERQEQLYGATK